MPKRKERVNETNSKIISNSTCSRGYRLHRIGVRLLIVSALGALATACGIVAVVMIRFLTTLAIPGWATFAAGILLLLMVQCVSASLVFVLAVLLGRQGFGFCPMLDYVPFILSHRTLWAAKEVWAADGR